MWPLAGKFDPKTSAHARSKSTFPIFRGYQVIGFGPQNVPASLSGFMHDVLDMTLPPSRVLSPFRLSMQNTLPYAFKNRHP